MINAPDRQAAVVLINEAVSSGCHKRPACREIGITLRTFERWVVAAAVGIDRRRGAVRPVPANKLSPMERAAALAVVNTPRFASLPPTQIVPILADEGRYVASESTLYRLLREADQLEHRGRARAPHARAVPRHCATGPNQLYAWDITYLPGPVAGMFFFLYLMLDVFSRKIVAHEVRDAESAAAGCTTDRTGGVARRRAPRRAGRAPGQRQPDEGVDVRRQACRAWGPAVLQPSGGE